MKTKTFFLLCLFLGFGLIKLSAQNGNDGTGSVVHYVPNGDFWADIVCDGVYVDGISGTATGHVVDHYNNGVFQWEDWTYRGTAIGLHGDIYTFDEIDKFSIPKQGIWVCHTHLKAGNKAIYNLVLIINMVDWTVNAKIESCTGNI
jgi:hypothetical protein